MRFMCILVLENIRMTMIDFLIQKCLTRPLCRHSSTSELHIWIQNLTYAKNMAVIIVRMHEPMCECLSMPVW